MTRHKPQIARTSHTATSSNLRGPRRPPACVFTSSQCHHCGGSSGRGRPQTNPPEHTCTTWRQSCHGSCVVIRSASMAKHEQLSLFAGTSRPPCCAVVIDDQPAGAHCSTPSRQHRTTLHGGPCCPTKQCCGSPAVDIASPSSTTTALHLYTNA